MRVHELREEAAVAPVEGFHARCAEEGAEQADDGGAYVSYVRLYKRAD